MTSLLPYAQQFSSCTDRITTFMSLHGKQKCTLSFGGETRRDPLQSRRVGGRKILKTNLKMGWEGEEQFRLAHERDK